MTRKVPPTMVPPSWPPPEFSIAWLVSEAISELRRNEEVTQAYALADRASQSLKRISPRCSAFSGNRVRSSSWAPK